VWLITQKASLDLISEISVLILKRSFSSSSSSYWINRILVHV